jgi:hypothetical protein
MNVKLFIVLVLAILIGVPAGAMLYVEFGTAVVNRQGALDIARIKNEGKAMQASLDTLRYRMYGAEAILKARHATEGVLPGFKTRVEMSEDMVSLLAAKLMASYPASNTVWVKPPDFDSAIDHIEAIINRMYEPVIDSGQPDTAKGE